MNEMDERHDVDGQIRRDVLKSGVIEEKQIKHENIEQSAENSPSSLSAADYKRVKNEIHSSDAQMDTERGMTSSTVAVEDEAEIKTEPGVCLCGSSEESSFMICCDHCGVWYHGSCLQVTRSLANKIETYACPPCISKDSDLHIVYRIPKREKQEKAREHQDEKGKKRKERESGGNERKNMSHTMKEEDESYDEEDRCHNCINCIRAINCGKCMNCESSRGPCHKRVCLQSAYWDRQKKKQQAAAALSSSSLSHSKPSSSHHGNTGRPRRDRGRPRTATWSTDDESSKGGSEKTSATSVSSATTSSQQLSGSSPQKGKRGRKKGWRKYKSGIIEKHLGHSSAERFTSTRTKGAAAIDDYEFDGIDRKLTPEEHRQIASATYRACTRRSAAIKTEVKQPKQCRGPGCTKAARRNSKYCSDVCGMRLARRRLAVVLPGHVADFYDQLPNATARSMRHRAYLEERIKQLSNETRILASYQAEVHKWIAAIANIEPVEDDDNAAGVDSDFIVHCAVCTMEFPAKQITKHVERCFVRTEKQSCFGTPFKSQVNPFNIFCDQFNKANDTYCKRIRVVCSEHYKPGPEADLKICGYPLTLGRTGFRSRVVMFPSVEKIINDGFCRRRRKHCQQHHSWVQNVLGLVDVELMNQVLKLDECFEKKRSLQLTESTRGDVLSLMTSERIVHASQREHLDGANVPTSSTSSPTLPLKADSTATEDSCHEGEKVYDEQCGDALAHSSNNSEDPGRAGIILNETSVDTRAEENPVGIS
uniref:CXXC-type zinc finger protein 1 n=2 Tax=Parascaris univalens TaxID=6257 RepID=A0A914ZMV8_PARUN